jgi:uncharacterized Zn-finger protein
MTRTLPVRKIYICTELDCQRQYTTSFSLTRHLTTHSDTKQYICHICHKSFALAQYLKEHAFTHSPDRQFKCDISGCLQSFRQAGKLSVHRRRSHAIIFKVTKIGGKSGTSTLNEDDLKYYKENEDSSDSSIIPFLEVIEEQ